MMDKNIDNQSDHKQLKWKMTKLQRSINKVDVNGPCQPFTDCWLKVKAKVLCVDMYC